MLDPMKGALELRDPSGVVQLTENDAIDHSALTGFSYPVDSLFAVLRRP